eukprot:scaffold888_cov246-Pinguiococcus_pyrenoidosus.AAC.14
MTEALPQHHDEHRHRSQHAALADELRHLAELGLQRRLLRLRLQSGADLAPLTSRAHAQDHHAAFGRRGDGFDALVAFGATAKHEDAVGRNAVAGAQRYQVSHHQLLGIDLLALSAAEHRAGLVAAGALLQLAELQLFSVVVGRRHEGHDEDGDADGHRLEREVPFNNGDDALLVSTRSRKGKARSIEHQAKRRSCTRSPPRGKKTKAFVRTLAKAAAMRIQRMTSLKASKNSCRKPFIGGDGKWLLPYRVRLISTFWGWVWGVIPFCGFVRDRDMHGRPALIKARCETARTAKDPHLHEVQALTEVCADVLSQRLMTTERPKGLDTSRKRGSHRSQLSDVLQC